MASFTIKNIPQELLDALRARAARERRSLTQEIIHLLEEETTRQAPPASPASVEAERDLQCAIWSEFAGGWESDRSAEDEIARIYAARSQGRDVDL